MKYNSFSLSGKARLFSGIIKNSSTKAQSICNYLLTSESVLVISRFHYTPFKNTRNPQVEKPLQAEYENLKR
jgi:hypothetical protein